MGRPTLAVELLFASCTATRNRDAKAAKYERAALWMKGAAQSPLFVRAGGDTSYRLSVVASLSCGNSPSRARAS